MDVGKGREQEAVSFAYMDVGKGREQEAVSFDSPHMGIAMQRRRAYSETKLVHSEHLNLKRYGPFLG